MARHLYKIKRRLVNYSQSGKDFFQGFLVSSFNMWPCYKKKFLMVGSESSGTTAIANLLFIEISSIRFLEEGDHKWVWKAYRNIYQGKETIRCYPKLQLFDAIKVPGFATIIDNFRNEFPNTIVIYIVRDPRDFINSAIKTWGVKSVTDLSFISWCKESWLKIPNEDPIERLSLRWKKYINTAMACDDIIYLKYEDFCNDKPGVIRDVAKKIGLPFNQTRIKKLADTQLCHKSVRNYEPHGAGGWKTSMLKKQHIRKIEQICRKEMLYWNYELDVI